MFFLRFIKREKRIFVFFQCVLYREDKRMNLYKKKNAQSSLFNSTFPPCIWLLSKLPVELYPYYTVHFEVMDCFKPRFLSQCNVKVCGG